MLTLKYDEFNCDVLKCEKQSRPRDTATTRCVTIASSKGNQTRLIKLKQTFTDDGTTNSHMYSLSFLVLFCMLYR